MDNTFDDNYLSQDEIDNLLDENYILTEFKKPEVCKTELRPCERTYHFQDMVFTPKYINEIASRNGLLWLLKERKQLHNVIFTNDEIYSLIEAICDNWKKYHENT